MLKYTIKKLKREFMAFKYENGKVIQVSIPKVIGVDAKKMLSAKAPKNLIKK